ncbi:MAG: GNAT family N-acetyltransferase [Cyclonatronaceae bacterium]
MNDEIVTAAEPKVKSIHHYARKKDFTVNIHTTESAFEKLDAEWTELACLSNQMICMSSGWASSWWRHFGRHKNRSLFIVTVYEEQKLVAIFPFYKGVTKVGGITMQRRLQLIGSGGSRNEQFGFSGDYGISDFLDVIVDPDYKTPIADLFVKLLLTPEMSRYKITFHQSRDDSYIMQTIYPLLKKSKRRVKAKHIDVCYYIEVDREGDFQDFIKNSRSSARRRFRQTIRARGIGNEFIIKGPDGIGEADQMLERLIHLHQERWNKAGYSGAFEDERFRKFFKEISFAAFWDNRLWIKQAVDGGGVSSVRMLLMYNGRYYDYMSGYDDDSPSSKHRPGIGLLLDLVECSLEHPIDRIELMRGDERYKLDFTDLAVNNWEIVIPEVRSWKTGVALPAAMVQLCSALYKHVSREKKLLKVAYKNAGFLHMLPGYFKFRINAVIQKIQ